MRPEQLETDAVLGDTEAEPTKQATPLSTTRIWKKQQQAADPKAHRKPASNVWAEGQERNTPGAGQQTEFKVGRPDKSHRLLWVDLQGWRLPCLEVPLDGSGGLTDPDG